jgi:uncharacterized integral membrane protein (TIGR00698 family)
MEAVQGTNADTVLENHPVISCQERLRQGVYAIAAAACLLPWVSPGIALAAGIALAMVMDNPFARAGRRASRLLLQACVVLLGFGMDLHAVLQAGLAGASLAAGSIVVTLFLGYALGRLLRVEGKIATLISAGTAICGGSAIAAVGSVLGSAEAEMAVAMGTVFLLNAVALYLFPVLGHLLHLSQQAFGTWAGVAIHDISSVVGAAATYGSGALQTATAVKLSRTLWIVPIALGVAMAMRRKAARVDQTNGHATTSTIQAPPSVGRVRIPWFIGLFVLASLARSAFPPVATIAPTLSVIAKAGLTLTLFLIGAGLSRTTLAAVGWRALLLGIALWMVISAGTLGIVMRG